jgi:hypothetical protein
VLRACIGGSGTTEADLRIFVEELARAAAGPAATRECARTHGTPA